MQGSILSLQIALIIIGIFVVIGIYFLSTCHGQYKLASVDKKLYRDHLYTKDTPRLDHEGIGCYSESGEKLGIDQSNQWQSYPNNELTDLNIEQNDMDSSQSGYEGSTNEKNIINFNRAHINNKSSVKDSIVTEDHIMTTVNPFLEHDSYSYSDSDDFYSCSIDDIQDLDSTAIDRCAIDEVEMQSNIINEKETSEAELDNQKMALESPGESFFSNTPKLYTEPMLDSELIISHSDDKTISGFEYIPTEGFEKISQIDYWVKIVGERDISREAVLAIYRENANVLTKKNNIYGLRLPDKVWCDLELESEDTRFGDLVITIQLANRSGAIEEGEITYFSALISNLSKGTGRGFTLMAPIESAISQANAISSFIRYFNSIFIVEIKPIHSDTFEMSTINHCSLQIGLERNHQNYYARNESVGRHRVCLYSLANMGDTREFDFDNIHSSTVKGVIFFTLPAQVRYPQAVFTEMVNTAKAFASKIKGEIIMPNQEDVEMIGRSIERVVEKMEKYGMPPGCDEAIRIF